MGRLRRHIRDDGIQDVHICMDCKHMLDQPQLLGQLQPLGQPQLQLLEQLQQISCEDGDHMSRRHMGSDHRHNHDDGRLRGIQLGELQPRCTRMLGQLQHQPLAQAQQNGHNVHNGVLHAHMIYVHMIGARHDICAQALLQLQRRQPGPEILRQYSW